ncbi:MAG: UDP-N-acetylglucosamine--N-acetylmuramyl-(pentapeptide) pyrophosphoryl-undecaprenol N-acetylglucosamine transferase [Oleiphilaceae bacterium]|jgi:UDP-N-acetylglucosamine--N-acetylmuramyl-(pentapeptide) pyrophosphoryl-undecaprenol N-acetylglucosamine transferase
MPDHQTRDKTFLIMAGGTGGHVYPALATATKLMQQKDRVVWLGSVGGMEEHVVKAAGIAFHGISVKGVRGKGLFKKLLSPVSVLWAVIQALIVISKVKPDAVLGMGGFASGPGGIAARILGKPLIIHEQNAVAGMTNRILSKFATTVMTAFPGVFSEAVKVKQTGNPLRESIIDMYYQPRANVPKDRKINLLILGGSLGAQGLNQVVPAALAKVDESIRPKIWHQTGKNKAQETETAYKSLNVEVKISEFIGDMANAYQWADFVICRAGALTISELCTVGLGAILVPYPFAVDDHQTKNAMSMTESGAAWLLPQKDVTPESLAEILTPLLSKRERISILSEAAHKLGQPDATDKVVAECRSACYA